MSCHISYHVISYIISYHIIYHSMSYHISYHISCHIIYISYHVVSYITYHISCHIYIYHIIAYHIYHIIYHIMSCHISYHISCHIISYPNIQKPTACHNDLCNLCAKMACSSFELIFTFLYAVSSILNAPNDSFLVSTCLLPTLPFFQSHKRKYNGIRYEDSKSYFSVIIQD